MDAKQLWKRYQDYLCVVPPVNCALDISRMNFADDFFERMEPWMQKAFKAMQKLESGGIANPDENRMVGHYWLRSPKLAPNPTLTRAIEGTLEKVKVFARGVHNGKVAPCQGGKFTDLLVVGIGGSALGPQFVSYALGRPSDDKMRAWFFDNTDPDGMDLTLAQIAHSHGTRGHHPLATTLIVVISKSGSTKETRNGQLEARAACERMGIKFERHVVAITGEGSELSQTVAKEGWLAQFPMWDWVGGRTSELSAVGLLPAALQGIDIEGMLEGARRMDEATRVEETRKNPAALLALMWYHATGGRGARDMVILPYKDRLLLFSRYLQQLIMESIGKELDVQGGVVEQGIAVYGNKGSTDQHAYIQQLRDGVPNFFVTFIEVLRERNGTFLEVEPEITSGDYLAGFLHGTREALFDKGRESMTITAPDCSPRTIGALIALYERAVGFYATLVNINAYHQPGVQAGKKAADDILKLQRKVLELLQRRPGQAWSSLQLAEAAGGGGKAEMVYHILRRLAFNGNRGVRMDGDHPGTACFSWTGSR
ncbi:MAG: glucose-6-phosphate isomerase [Verrucomicrobiae bacterium]|nr:glucose-6-phosphate isomerase [Verrucomicrobiae bacterium]